MEGVVREGETMKASEWRERLDSGELAGIVKIGFYGRAFSDIISDLAACERERDEAQAKQCEECRELAARAEKAEAELATLKARCEGLREAFVAGAKYTPLSGREEFEELWIEQVRSEAVRRYPLPKEEG